MSSELVSTLVSELVGFSLELLSESELCVFCVDLEPELESDCPPDDELSLETSAVFAVLFKLLLGTAV